MKGTSSSAAPLAAISFRHSQLVRRAKERTESSSVDKRYDQETEKKKGDANCSIIH